MPALRLRSLEHKMGLPRGLKPGTHRGHLRRESRGKGCGLSRQEGDCEGSSFSLLLSVRKDGVLGLEGGK